MLQRKQTVFIFLSFILTIVCLCLPIGSFEPQEMGTSTQMFNLWILDNGKHNYSVAALFVILLITCPISLKSIFAFSNRVFQGQLCLINASLFVLWHIVYIICVLFVGPDGYKFHVSMASSIPAICLILQVMARKAILDDEKLIRSADRIR